MAMNDGIAPNVFPFHACRTCSNGLKPKQTIELGKHRAHAPLLLAEMLGHGQSAISKRSSFDKGIYGTIVPIVKYREIFQVYNNHVYSSYVILQAHKCTCMSYHKTDYINVRDKTTKELFDASNVFKLRLPKGVLH